MRVGIRFSGKLYPPIENPYTLNPQRNIINYLIMQGENFIYNHIFIYSFFNHRQLINFFNIPA